MKTTPSKRRNPRWPKGWLGDILKGYWKRRATGIATITMPLAVIRGKFSKS